MPREPHHSSRADPCPPEQGDSASSWSALDPDAARSETSSWFAGLLQQAAHVPLLPARAALPLGSTLASGRLQVLRRLGSGGMGVVYEVFDAERRARVALKLLSEVDPENVYRLKNEFRSLRSLRHENLVRLHELFADAGHWFYTMELVDGECFDTYVRPCGALCEARLRTSMQQLVAAVGAIHRAHKLHRDLKPSNVLIDAQGKLRVLDFGLAIDACAGGVGQTLSEAAICGTPAYMAPEQAAGRAAADASDRYALGVMLFEALTGSLPFVGSAGEVVAAKQRDKAPRASAYVSAVPPDLDELCSALLEQDPDERPNGEELARYFQVSERGIGLSGARVTKFCGRERELALLCDAYRDACAGRAIVVSISGASGIGKSALCDAFLRQLPVDADITLLTGCCHERESVPFNVFDPLIDALSRALRRMPDSELERLVPLHASALTRLFPVLSRVAPFRALAEAAGDLDPQALSRRAFAALADLLRGLRARGPVVVLLDDLHWADADSLRGLELLLDPLRKKLALLLVVSYRAAPTSPSDATKIEQLLSRLLGQKAPQRELALRRIALEPLSEQATAQLVAELLPRARAGRDDAIAEIVRGSQGSPLFAKELAHFACVYPSSTQAPSFSQLLSARIATLSLAAARLLELVALAGEPMLAQIAMQAAEATHEELEQLEQAQLLRIGASHSAHGRGKTLICYHDRIRECVAEKLDRDVRRAHAKRLADVLCELDDASAELLYRCLIDTGEFERASRIATVAAERAAHALAFDRAAELYARAALSSRGASELERAALYAECGGALEAAGRGREAAARYRAAAELTSGEPRLVLLQRAADQLLLTGDFREGSALLERVCNGAGVPFSRGLPGTAGRLALLELRMKRRGLRVTAPVRRAPTLKLEAASTLVKSFMNYEGASLQARCAAAEYLNMALGSGDTRHVALALGFSAQLAASPPSRLERAQEFAGRLAQLSAEHPVPSLQGFADATQGIVAYFAGDTARARPHFSRALAILRAGNSLHAAVESAQIFAQMCCFELGEFADIARDTPTAIDDAVRRGRVYSAVALSGSSGLPAWLVPDDPTAAAQRLYEAHRLWLANAALQFPDYQLLTGEMLLSLYRGDPVRGIELADLHSSRVPRGAHRAGIRMGIAIYRSMCAASALRARPRHGPSVSALRAILKRTQRQVRATRWEHVALLLEVPLALERGDRERALKSLLRLGERRVAEPTDVGAAAGLMRFGALLGGERGRALTRTGIERMQAQGVKNCEAMAELLCPGCRAD